MSQNKINPGENGSVINQDYELVATDRLLPHPRNVNRGDLAAIGGSIAENGFYGAIVAQKSTGHILAGNHRYEAAKTAGITEVPVTWVDVDDDRALRILLADNRTTRLGHDDQEALAALLQEILENSETLAGTGFDEAALDQLLAEVGACGSVDEEQQDGSSDGDAKSRTLSDRFLVPPFSVLDARQGYWQERKRAWIALGIKSELGRGGAEPGGSARPACDYSNKERGDGAGKPIQASRSKPHGATQ